MSIHPTVAELRDILDRGGSEHCAAVHETAGDGTAKPGGGESFAGLGARRSVRTRLALRPHSFGRSRVRSARAG